MCILLSKTISIQIVIIIFGCLLVSACASDGKQPSEIRYLGKTDIDTVADIHRKRSSVLLNTLTEKLYRRNPLYCKKNGEVLENCIKQALANEASYRKMKLGECQGSQCIELGLDEGFQGDRVLALTSGLADMLNKAYINKQEFFLTDELDPQKLYNAARNIEITVWRIANRRDALGQRYILTDTINGNERNLSYERLFGKLISLQDTLAEVIAQRDNRLIKNVIQRLATAVFLPL
jgi:hypothetical protein